ncbi:hypothetical protein [Streptomyces cellulosae]|uniref:Transposase n=1 Tax=Streptomyces cellulosae TaxID=1968 RepID=A0ABW7XSM5_STRCE
MTVSCSSALLNALVPDVRHNDAGNNPDGGMSRQGYKGCGKTLRVRIIVHNRHAERLPAQERPRR